MEEREVKITFESDTLERYIVAFLLKDSSFFLKFGNYLTTKDYARKSYFRDSKYQAIINFAVAYTKSHDKPVTRDTLMMLSEKKFNVDPLLQKSFNILVNNVFATDLSGTDREYIEEETIKFIRTQRAVEATLQNQMDISNGKFDQLDDRMRKAINVNLDKDFGLSLMNIDDTLAVIQQEDKDSGLTFGSPSLDQVLGSPKAGELLVICGTPGVGKTIWLGNMAVANFRRKKKIMFFSLEVDKRRLSARLYRSILSMSGMDLMSAKKEQVQQVLNEFEGGDIRIKNYPANTASCNDFDAFLEDLAINEGWKPDAIVIDYILITATNDKRTNDNMYAYYKLVSEEMRNLAVKWNCPVFSASQVNREGMGDKGGTKQLVTSRDLANSRGILDTADYCLIINQTNTEKQAGENDHIAEQRILVDKNRNGESGSVYNFTIDYNTMTIKEGKKVK